MPARALRSLLVVLALLPLALAGCDTSNPGTGLAEVQGVYTFTDLRFEPEASALAAANVLNRLDVERTGIEIFSDGRALLRYAFAGQSTSGLVVGTARATAATVTISATTNDDAAKMATLLLPSTLTLSRVPGDDRTLSRTFPQRAINLEAFDASAYSGQRAVQGTLYVNLRRDR